MNYIFEVIDKSKRRIHLTYERWAHILEHKGMEQHLELIQETLKKPLTIIQHKEENLYDYYLFFKHRKEKLKYLKVVVKYLNGTGFVISSHFVRHIN